MEEEVLRQSRVEIEDRLHLLRDRESKLREDYDKCIAWRVRVYELLYFFIYSIFQH